MSRIENAIIKKVDLSMADHNCFTLEIHVEGHGWGCCIGGYCLGHGSVDSTDLMEVLKGW